MSDYYVDKLADLVIEAKMPFEEMVSICSDLRLKLNNQKEEIIEFERILKERIDNKKIK